MRRGGTERRRTSPTIADRVEFARPRCSGETPPGKRHQQHRRAGLLPRREDVALHDLARLVVQRGEKFVYQQQTRLERQRPRQGDTLLIPPESSGGVCRRKRGAPRRQARRACALASRRLMPWRVSPDYVRLRRHPWKQIVVLEEHRDVVPYAANLAPTKKDMAA